jgi:hypothetical protein
MWVIRPGFGMRRFTSTLTACSFLDHDDSTI